MLAPFVYRRHYYGRTLQEALCMALLWTAREERRIFRRIWEKQQAEKKITGNNKMENLTIVEPCPCCGIVPTEYTHKEGFALDASYIIYCPNCGFSCDKKEVYPTEALTAWNICAKVNRHKNELKPCPFCGSTELKVLHNNLYYILCTECGIKFGFFKETQEAINVWNKRAAPDPLPNAADTNQDENLREGEEK